MEDIIHKHPRRWLQLKTLSNAIKYAVLILKGSSHNQVFASDPPEGVSGVRTSEVIYGFNENSNCNTGMTGKH